MLHCLYEKSSTYQHYKDKKAILIYENDYSAKYGDPYTSDINPYNQQAQDIITAFNNGGYPRTFSSSILGTLNLDVLSLSGYWNIVIGLGSDYSEEYQSFEAALIPLNFELE